MIHDYLRTEKMSGVRFPTIKGHVKIALKDIRTGKTDIAFEGDNIITDAVKDIFASNLCGAMDYRSMLPLYSKMFGGILCFKDLLNVDSPTVADAKKDYYIPDSNTNELTAHAGQTRFTSQADDIKRGDPLNTSTTVADGSVTLAWEWGSAAGNGKIKSVALTHADVGDAGLGSGSDAFKAMTPNINASFGLTANKPVWFIDADGYGYSMGFSGSTVSLTKFPVAHEDAGLIDIPYDYLAGKASTTNVSVETTYSAGCPYFCYDKVNKKIYLFYNESKTDSVSVDIINISNWNSISKTHDTWSLDVSAGPLYISGNNQGPCLVPLANGYVYLPQFASYANALTGYLRINLSSTAQQFMHSVSSSENMRGGSGIFAPDTTGRILAGKNFVINHNILYPTSIGEPDEMSYWGTSNNWGNATLNQGTGLVHSVYRLGHNGANIYYPSISKFYLASKFNLPEEVTKSNVQSMVITYTLTEV